MKIRCIVSALFLVLFYVMNWFSKSTQPLIQGNLATDQLSNSDSGYVASMTAIRFLDGKTGFLWFIFVALMIWIWFKPVKEIMAKTALTTLVILLMATSSFAYFDKRDLPEFYEIGPNQSAFMIPMQGANKTNQKAFMSVDYLKENKIAAKRVKIPHMLLEGAVRSATVGTTDMYIPTSKLIIVDRAPYSRSWIKEAGRGTSTKDEGMYFESNESINMDCGINISATVHEEDVAIFLYNFGSNNAKEEAYASVSYGRSLADVMDDVVHKRVQTLLSREFGSVDISAGIKTKAPIIDKIEKQVKEEFKLKGITIEFVGYASGLNFDPAVQEEINKVFKANMSASAYPSLIKMMPIYERQAQIKVTEGTATAMNKWDGKLPTFMIIADKIIEFFQHLFGMTPHVAK